MMQSTRLFHLVFISFSSNRVHSLHKIFKDWGKLGTKSKDSDRDVATCLQQLKTLSESRDLMQWELEELRAAAQDVAGLVEIPEGNEDELLTLAGKLRKVPKSFERFVSATTRQYVGHVLGLVKSYWPRTPLDAHGQGAKADYTDEQFHQYLQETSTVADKIVENLNKSESPWTIRKNCLACGP